MRCAIVLLYNERPPLPPPLNLLHLLLHPFGRVRYHEDYCFFDSALRSSPLLTAALTTHIPYSFELFICITSHVAVNVPQK